MTTFEEIYQAYSDDVYRFSYWLCGNATEAEDIVSETFLRLWGSLDDLHVETVKAYVLMIARNVFISKQRRLSRERQLPTRQPASEPPPDRSAELQDELRKAMTALQALPEGERAALLMRVQHDLPYEEIARTLGITIAAVKVRIHRARLKLANNESSLRGQPCR